MRRSLSMFEHPEEILKQEKAIVGNTEALGSIMDVDDVPPLKLPHFKPDEESLPRITTETMVDILDGKYGECYDQSIIVDCRFEYEYEGGHIAGAINVTSKEELATQLLQTSPAERALLVFHCEYSAHRAPLLAKFLRHRDRAANAHRYPLLSYPEVYILDGGYSSFFSDHSLRCIPQNYVEMASKEHANACERGLGKIKQQRVKLGRAQTFAFAR
jgi:M-phase inducer tyrosine phosphatase